MKSSTLALAASAFIIGIGGVSADAQQPSTMVQQETHEHATEQDRSGTTKQSGMMGCGMMRATMRGGMMGQHGVMNGDPVALRIIFALMDGDGDGTVSLEELQAAHGRIFKAMDANKDGVLTPEEIQTFMRGSRASAPNGGRAQDKDEPDPEH